MPQTLQYSRLAPCRSCQREINHVRDTSMATPNWMCPNCGARTPASQYMAFVAFENATPDKATFLATPGLTYTLATPDLGTVNSVIRP